MGGSEIRRGRRTGSSETRPAVASASRRSSARPARFGQGPSQSRKRRAVRRGRISKATGRKVQISGKEIQSQGKQIPSFFLPRIGAFQGLTGESILRERFGAFFPTPQDGWKEFKVRRNKIKTSRNKIKVRRDRNPNPAERKPNLTSFHESSLFNGLLPTLTGTLASRFSLRLAPRRPAPARVDVRRRAAATPRHTLPSQEPSRNSCPPPAALAAFWGTRISYSADRENRK